MDLDFRRRDIKISFKNKGKKKKTFPGIKRLKESITRVRHYTTRNVKGPYFNRKKVPPDGSMDPTTE